ncbi:zinc-ribbon domain-containing protein [Massilia pinisoli]|uniref:Zinc-ribbon domain-containing protein n=1 Tax=Massilia pinisoli TaxID=1772194 RepID=A0ABT1ZPU3_9BURK|nr:DUF3426 domain-containing protein [Massilia pinisoli]MCS0581928.1 zinc-ribbon domain-containing protein [Massilia pinisoli]
MALATQCPHCHTTFRVAADQLKLRGGIVRCGACQSIFDGNAHLIDLAKPAAPAPTETPPTVPAPSDQDDALPVYTLDFGHTFDPLGILPNVDERDEAQAPAPAAPRAHVWRTGGARAPEDAETTPAHPDEAAAAEGPDDDAAPAEAPVIDAAPADAPVIDAAPVDAERADAAPADEPLVAAAPADTERADVAPASESPDVALAEEHPVSVPPSAYAPAGRVEPRLEPVFDAAHDAAAVPPSEPPEDTAAATHADAAPASAYAPAGRVEPNFGLPVDEEIVAQPLPDYEPEPEPEPAPQHEPDPTAAPAAPAGPTSAADIPSAALPLRASAASEPPAPTPAMIPPVVASARSKAARASDARARRSKLTPTKIEPPRLRIAADSDADEPEFVKRSRRQERMGRTQRLWMVAGSVALLLALLAQAVLAYRNVLAAQHPGLRPVLQGACAVLGCRVELPAQAENLVIETGELTTLGPGTYALNTVLRNQGSLVLAWPSIELELTDASDKPVLRRVLAPADYLPPGTPAANGFAPHSEQPVALHFTLAGLQPSGYHTFVFYP